ncbi:MAG: stage III sporulation protein AF [Clostridia bacterium]|nr:stage III sporulation protein AF [Clostridia bacterium]
MQEYLSALIGVSLLGGIVRMLTPEENLGKYLRFTVGLCLLCAIIQPLLGILTEGKNIRWEEWFDEKEYETENYDEIYNQSLQNGAKKQAKEWIKYEIYREFSFSEESAEIEAVFLSENEICSLSEVRVFLRGEGVLTDPREIVDFVRSKWDCPCIVVYE